MVQFIKANLSGEQNELVARFESKELFIALRTTKLLNLLKFVARKMFQKRVPKV